MKMYLLLAIGTVMAIALSGCIETPPPMGIIPTGQIFNFAQFSTSCTLYNLTNISNATGRCGAEYPSFSYWDTNTSLWYLLCCTFDDKKCAVGSYSDVYQMCSNQTGSSTDFSTYFANGRWQAVCCNFNGGNCYIDTNIIPSDNTTICDMSNLKQSIFSSSYNATSTEWVGVCCLTGG